MIAVLVAVGLVLGETCGNGVLVSGSPTVVSIDLDLSSSQGCSANQKPGRAGKLSLNTMNDTATPGPAFSCGLCARECPPADHVQASPSVQFATLLSSGWIGLIHHEFRGCH